MQAGRNFRYASDAGALEPPSGNESFMKVGQTGAMQVVWRELCIMCITLLPIALFDLPKEKAKV